MNEELIGRALEDFPEHRYSEETINTIRERHDRLGVAFAPCGVDADNRFIIAADDGTVLAYDLDTADPALETVGVGFRSSDHWRFNADRETIGVQQHPHEYMLDRDTSDWIWVHPQWRYLTSNTNSEF